MRKPYPLPGWTINSSYHRDLEATSWRRIGDSPRTRSVTAIATTYVNGRSNTKLQTNRHRIAARFRSLLEQFAEHHLIIKFKFLQENRLPSVLRSAEGR